MANWARVRVADLGRVVTGRTPPGNDPDYFNGGVPFLTPSDMTDCRRVKHTARSLSPYGVKQLARNLVPYGVGVSCIGWQMGKAVLIDRPTVTNQQINSVIVDNGIADALFVYYSFCARRAELFNLGAGGSRTPILNKGDFERLPFSLPSLGEQRAIARVLGTLDDKIELNRRMSETLEQMARALFRSWFVDFDPVLAKKDGRWKPGQSLPGMPAHLYDLFPDSFVDSELGQIPEGWEVRPFADTTEIIGGGTPKTSVAEYWNGDIPWFSVVDAPRSSDVWVLDTEKKVTLKGIEGSSARVVPVGTTIISARGTVGRLALVGVSMAMNQSCYGLCGRTGKRGYYNYFATRKLVERLQQHTHGSVFDTITRETLRTVSTVVPPSSLVERFEISVAPSLERIRVGLGESSVLVELRDTLLPKLISGELRVPKARTEAPAG